jgi:cytochrome P450
VTEAIDSSEMTGSFRLVEPDVAKDPGAYFETLRSKCPVAKSPDFGGFWLLSRYEDVHEAALTPQVFSSASGINIPVIAQPPVICIEQDDPEHRKYRRPLQGWFSVKRVEASRARSEPSSRTASTRSSTRAVATSQRSWPLRCRPRPSP